MQVMFLTTWTPINVSEKTPHHVINQPEELTVSIAFFVVLDC